MDRQQAIEALRSEGFIVTQRQWSLGDSICVAALPVPDSDIRAYRVMIFLYPERGGWQVLNPATVPALDQAFPSLAEAVPFAADLMRQEIEGQQSDG